MGWLACTRHMTNFADRTICTGDNLDSLRGLNSASVDLIYLDLQFNSNRSYAAPVGSAAFRCTWVRCGHGLALRSREPNHSE